MKSPIKLNRSGWPSALYRWAITLEDPRPLAGDVAVFSADKFSSMVTVLKFGSTFRTTRPGRQKYSNRYVLDVYNSTKPSILDVGASDGSTALDLIRALKDDFGHYFVTDLNLSVRCGENSRGVTYFMDREDQCILCVSKRWLTYAVENGNWSLLRLLARARLAGSGQVTHWHEVLLIQPKLLELSERDPRITLMRYDMFVPWTGQPPDLIKMANLLNPSSFSAAQLREAIRVQCLNLARDGRLLIVDNRKELEKFSVFQKTDSCMRLVYEHAGGSDASAYVPLG